MPLGPAEDAGGCNPRSHKPVSSENRELQFVFFFFLAKNCQLN